MECNVNTNLILATDSYKLTHWNMYPRGTTGIYSYFESRNGAQFNETVFFGLQSIIKRYLEGVVITSEALNEANELARHHFGRDMLNMDGWMTILLRHGGKLPLRIKAVPEGTPVPTGNVMMTVENTDPDLPWLTNAMESLLTHVWYPSTVASLSRSVKQMMASFLEETSENPDAINFMLHDFGYRGVSSHESAEMGGMGHLINFLGTDTLPAMQAAVRDYGAPLETLAFSVPATEHSIMTSLGPDGEEEIVGELLEDFPSGILSVVADS
jgi:nicotinamide phosphoribosyltransferase